jgi:hypothetical protein
MFKRIAKQKGFALLLTMVLMTSLSAISGGLVISLTHDYRAMKFKSNDDKSFWLSEAGMQKAIWNLMTTVANGGQGENWTTAGTTESFGDGNYKMVVVRWDWALAANGGLASATTSEASHGPENVNDGDDGTYWETVTKPLPPSYESVTIAFPYTLTINKVRFVVPSGASQQRPKEYQWQVSTNGTNYTTVFSNANGTTDELNEFTAVNNVNFLRLYITKTGGGALSLGVKVATIEAIGSKITVTGTVNSQTRVIEQTVAVDDATTTSTEQIDWNETT